MNYFIYLSLKNSILSIFYCHFHIKCTISMYRYILFGIADLKLVPTLLCTCTCVYFTVYFVYSVFTFKSTDNIF